MVKSIIGLITGGMGVAKEVLKKSNTEQSRKYLDEWQDAEKDALEAEHMVELEKAKPQDQQFDNVVEHFEAKAEHLHKLSKVLEDAAKKELERRLAERSA